MAAPATIEDFLGLVRRSEQVESARLEAFLSDRRGAGLPGEPRPLAALMVREGLLTNFQAEQLLQGKWRGFSLGGYRILERLGAGGTGTVYLAEHQVMRRRVAIKVLPTDYASTPGVLARFQQEAQAVAALDHPNIVRAYDFRQEGPLHFLVMEHVDGVSLQELLVRQGPLEVARAADYARQAALGLEHAHEAGLVHRDVKPANLLVDRAGTVKLLDLGLARYVPAGQESLTQKLDDNAVMGTADYLAPEQALSLHAVDIRADVYSLGATLYALLTGGPPFHSGSVTQKLLWHQMLEPRPLRAVRPEVPEGLAAVVARMMAKAPHDRYATPAEVVDALAPWAHGPFPPDLLPDHSGNSAVVGPKSPYVRGAARADAVRADPPSERDNATPVPATLADTHIPEGNGLRKQLDLPGARRPQPAARSRDRAEPRSTSGRWVVFFCLVALFVALLSAGGLVFFLWRALSKDTQASASRGDNRQVAIVLPDGVGEQFRLGVLAVPVDCVAFSPNGRFILAGGADRAVRLWDLKDRELRSNFYGHQDRITSVAFSSDSQFAVSASADKTVRIWDLDTVTEVTKLEGHDKTVLSAVFSADGKQILSGGEDRTIRLWDVGRRQQARRFLPQANAVSSVALAPSGRTAVSAGWDGTVRLWDTKEDKPLHVFSGHAKRANSVVFCPDGRRALSGGDDGAVRLWDTDASQLLHSFAGHTGPVLVVAVSPDGKRALSGGRDRTIRLWELEPGRLLLALEGHTNAVTGLSFAPDGRHFVSSSLDKTVRVWGLPPVSPGPR